MNGLEQVTVIPPSTLKLGERWRRVWRAEIKAPIQLRIARNTDVGFAEQPDQTIHGGFLNPAHPTVEVEAVQNLIAIPLSIQFVDLRAGACAHEHKRKRRAQVTQ